MLLCLYMLPRTIPHYMIPSGLQYYLSDCSGNVAHHLNIPRGIASGGNYSGNNGVGPDAEWLCSVMEFCGFPYQGELANNVACPLLPIALSYNLSGVSSNQVDALCFNNATRLGQGCPLESQVYFLLVMVC